jgi:hypothetical protein
MFASHGGRRTCAEEEGEGSVVKLVARGLRYRELERTVLVGSQFAGHKLELDRWLRRLAAIFSA